VALINEGGYRPAYRPPTVTTPPVGAPDPFYQPFDVTPYLSDPGMAPAKPTFGANTDYNNIVPQLIDWRIQQRQYDKASRAAATANNAVYTAAGGGGGGGAGAYGWKGTTGLASGKGAGNYGLQMAMWQSLLAANNAMKKELGKGFSITDGWRSLAQQESLKRRKPNLAATPGRSIHGIGLAADLNLTAKQKRWMFENAGRFGLYAPMKSKEPWHWQLQANRWNGNWGGR